MPLVVYFTTVQIYVSGLLEASKSHVPTFV